MAKNEVMGAIKNLEKLVKIKFEGVDSKFGGMERRFDGLETRFDGLETRFDDFKNETLSRFDHVFSKLDLFNSEYHSVNAGLRRIEDEHRIIGHAEILKEITVIKSSNN